MKKVFAIIIVIFHQNALSQTYTFDRFIQYNGYGLDKTIFMFNSENATYYFFAKTFEKEITGNIIDLGNKARHLYSFHNHENAVNFEYVSSKREPEYKSKCYDKNNVIEVIEKPIDNTITNFTVLKFKNSKKKKTIASSKISAIIYNIPVFSEIMNKFFYHFVYCQKINLPEYYIPTSVEMEYNNGYKTKDILVHNKKITLVLAVK
jgi:hypothetical protein